METARFICERCRRDCSLSAAFDGNAMEYKGYSCRKGLDFIKEKIGDLSLSRIKAVSTPQMS